MALTISAGKNTTACTRISADDDQRPGHAQRLQLGLQRVDVAVRRRGRARPAAARPPRPRSAATASAARVSSRRRRTRHLRYGAGCRNPYVSGGEPPRGRLLAPRRGGRGAGSLHACPPPPQLPAHRRPPGGRHRRRPDRSCSPRCCCSPAPASTGRTARRTTTATSPPAASASSPRTLRARQRRPRRRRHPARRGPLRQGPAEGAQRRRQAGVRRHRPLARRRRLPRRRRARDADRRRLSPVRGRATAPAGGDRRARPRPARRTSGPPPPQGTGTQTLDWDVEDGNWSVVVMNADGSAGVDAGVSAGANLPFLDDLGLWLVDRRPRAARARRRRCSRAACAVAPLARAEPPQSSHPSGGRLALVIVGAPDRPSCADARSSCRRRRPAVGQRQARRRRLLQRAATRAHRRRDTVRGHQRPRRPRGLPSADRQGRFEPRPHAACARHRDAPGRSSASAARTTPAAYLDATAPHAARRLRRRAVQARVRRGDAATRRPRDPTKPGHQAGVAPASTAGTTLDWDVEPDQAESTLVPDERRRLARAWTRPSSPARRCRSSVRSAWIVTRRRTVVAGAAACCCSRWAQASAAAVIACRICFGQHEPHVLAQDLELRDVGVPRARKNSTRPSTSSSGALAPEEMPTTRAPSSHSSCT